MLALSVTAGVVTLGAERQGIRDTAERCHEQRVEDARWGDLKVHHPRRLRRRVPWPHSTSGIAPPTGVRRPRLRGRVTRLRGADECADEL